MSSIETQGVNCVNSTWNHLRTCFVDVFCLVTLMRPKAPKCEGQVTSGRQVYNHAAQGTQSERQAGDKWETSVNSCGPRHPE